MARNKFSTNFLFNVFGSIFPIIVSLGTVPFYLHLIGTDRYGIVAISWILLGYLGFLDFGLSRASANALAQLGQATSRQRSPVLMTAFYSNLGLGALGGLILYPIGDMVLLHFVRIPPDLMAETRHAYPWMAVMLPLGMINGVATGAMESRERFLLSNMLNSSTTMAGQIIPLICIHIWGPQLTVVLPSIVLSRLGMIMLSYCVVMALEWPIRPLDFDVTWLKRLLGYGSWVSISSLINPLLDTSNQLIIGATLGVTSVGQYTVPMNLAMRSQVVATALARTLFPRLSRAERGEAVDLTRRATSSLTYGFGLICAPGIVFSGAFLHMWVGGNFADVSRPVAEILMFGAWTNGIAFLPYGLLQGQGRPHITAKVSMVEILPFFCVLWLFIKWWGLPGAAAAWTLRVTINLIALYLLSDCLSRQTWRLVPGMMIMTGALIVSLLVPMTLLVSAGAAAVVGLAMAFAAYRLDPGLHDMVHRLVPRAGGKPRVTITG
ncbi:flippase [Komagataeibacter xylinus]|uniref:Flippase n=1 Tax=Komagataeibacter xylinus TaxID=28448 RepID=A0A318PK99_KOMXY|nr:oligosaccharide flippase family protein [Komagataeibacter xylinus]AZV39865.1 flippase [Komagataeibacter xylinus]PYD57942.1 flippase [Komagataeibacter xylinus]GBQ73832.1 polysaccharide biosynthesis protein [Komagataeibacter xylinus NBRC 15237]